MQLLTHLHIVYGSFWPRRQRQVVVKEAVQPPKPQIVTIESLIERKKKQKL